MFILHWDQTKCPVQKRYPDFRVSTFRGSTILYVTMAINSSATRPSPHQINSYKSVPLQAKEKSKKPTTPDALGSPIQSTGTVQLHTYIDIGVGSGEWTILAKPQPTTCPSLIRYLPYPDQLHNKCCYRLLG